MERKNVFLSFIDKFLTLPLWVKETLYFQLREDLTNYAAGTVSPNSVKEDLYQYYKPTPTYLGKKELETRSNNLEANIYKFLESANIGGNIIETTLNNYWTLEECAVLNLRCLEKEYVVPPKTGTAKAMVLYLAGKIRIGEYLKRIGKVDIDQLDVAIRKQKELAANGKQMGMADVLISLGYITDDDSKMVLYIKDESKKRFIFNADILGKNAVAATSSSVSNTDDSQSAKMEQLTRENNHLKSKIKAITDILLQK